MIPRSFTAGLLLGLTLLAASSEGGCPGPRTRTNVRLEQVEVPRGVFSISGEVAAFRAAGDAGRAQKVTLPLGALRARVGAFERAFLYEFDAAGRRLSRQTLRLGADASATFRATAGRTYLVYADLGTLYQNTYDFTCHLGQMRLGGAQTSRVCSLIYCAGQSFRASQLGRLVEGLPVRGGPGDFGDRPVGGFNLGGEACSQCLDHAFYPTDVCSVTLPRVERVAASERVVYHHAPYDAGSGGVGRTQIYRMGADGGAPVNLSNSETNDYMPDVSPDGGRVVFVRDAAASARPGTRPVVTTLDQSPDGWWINFGDDGVETSLYLMDADGSNVRPVPNTQSAWFPRWGGGDEPFIVFLHDLPTGARQPVLGRARRATAIFSVRPDGTRLRQITRPQEPDEDMEADVLRDNEHIVFSRRSVTSPLSGGLYVQRVEGFWPEAALPNTGVTPALPTVSHGGDLIAFSTLDVRKEGGVGVSELQLRVGRLKSPAYERWELEVLHVIPLRAPFHYVTGLSFSNDDKRLYFSAQELEPGGRVLGSGDIFSVNLDGSDLRRVRGGPDLDGYPCASPR